MGASVSSHSAGISDNICRVLSALGLGLGTGLCTFLCGDVEAGQHLLEGHFSRLSSWKYLTEI